MRISMPLFKIIERPLLSISGSWVDAAPFIIFFFILLVASLCLRRGGRWVPILRPICQILASFTFIIFLHRCLCMIRGWVFALRIVGRNDIVAFGSLCLFVLLVTLTLVIGRVFCGWACPLALVSELTSKVAAARARLNRRARLFAGYLMLTGTTLIILWFAYLVRPGTQFITENVAAIWGVWLLLSLFVALPLEHRDAKFKLMRYVSLGLWLFLSILGIWVTSPWCTLLGDEVDYSSIVSLLSVILASMIISMSWCRYLCPLGATLGWLAARAPVKLVNRKPCTDCGACASMCPMGALEKGKIDHASCIYCGKCVGECGFAWEDEADGKQCPGPTGTGLLKEVEP